MSESIDRAGEEEAVLDPLQERAVWLGYAGLLPFLLTAVVLWMSPFLISTARSGQMMLWGLYYGAIILSFLGGIRWGLALTNDKSISNYVTINQLTNSIVPPLIGWLAVVPADLIPGIAPNYLARHVILLASFLLLMQADRRASEDGFAPEWYGPLRFKITIFLTLIMVLIMMRLINFGW